MKKEKEIKEENKIYEKELNTQKTYEKVIDFEVKSKKRIYIKTKKKICIKNDIKKLNLLEKSKTYGKIKSI